MRNLLLQWKVEGFQKKKKIVWHLAPICLFWCIWKECNQRTFKNEELSNQRLKNLFIRTLFEWSRDSLELKLPSLLNCLDTLYCGWLYFVLFVSVYHLCLRCALGCFRVYCLYVQGAPPLFWRFLIHNLVVYQTKIYIYISLANEERTILDSSTRGDYTLFGKLYSNPSRDS